MNKVGAEIVWCIGVVAWYVIRHPFERRMRLTGTRRSLFDWRERLLLGLAAISLFLVPILYVSTGSPAALERTFIPLLAIAGCAILCAALWLFRRSHADLGPNWSISVELRQTHALVRNGTYRFVRHPMYTSFVLLGLAQFMLLPNWFAGSAGLVSVVVLLIFRIGPEEQMMLEHFGEEYRAYMERTKRLVPYIL
jgi:protein-S-isoprenylcysteine O-methyltransferase Ste14